MDFKNMIVNFHKIIKIKIKKKILIHKKSIVKCVKYFDNNLNLLDYFIFLLKQVLIFLLN